MFLPNQYLGETMNEAVKRERFGRYLILDHLVNGGMAKICRARFLGEQAGKLVAIKMVQPQYSNDEAFKTMFLDEIKVTFPLIHPNVIQTNDYGFNKGQLFVAMEYCDGKNLKEFLEKLREKNFGFPVNISIYIISQACQGLHYAHTYKDKLTGQAANIIHRDISPHNIMLSYDGAVKIIDFGIAKSHRNSEATQAGTIKGKLSYLAPEYLEGLELDPRYDQFALGITLWEMLCNRKLFKDGNDLAILKKIQECKIPTPSSINHLVPAELDEIVLKALSKDRTKRFKDLDQMNRALMKCLYASYPEFNANDLNMFSQDLFRDEIIKDSEKMFEYGKIDLRSYLSDLKIEIESGTKDFQENGRSQTVNSYNQLKAKEHVLDFGFDKKKNKAKPSISIGKKKSTEIITDENLSMSLKTIGVNSSSVSTKNALINEKNNQKKINKIDSVDANESSKEHEKGEKNYLVFAAMFVLMLGYAAYRYLPLHKNENKIAVVKPVKTAPVVDEQDRKPADEDADLASIVLSHFSKKSMQVFINGKKIELDLLSSTKVSIRKDFTLRVQIEGRKHFVKKMRIENSSTVEVEIPEMPFQAYGYLNTLSTCAAGEIRYEIFEEERSNVIPMEESFGVAFPLAIGKEGQTINKSYLIFFKRIGETSERKIEIIVKAADQEIDLCDYL